MRVNTKYPNIPSNFPEEVRIARNKLGWSLRKVATLLGLKPVSGATSLSQLERRQRNFSYDMAVKVRDALGMDFELPEPDLSKREPIIRNRTRLKLEYKPFFVEIDGELIKVMTYYPMGSVRKGKNHLYKGET